ncbi:VOC family protein [Mycolicibacterium neoaurum]|uniref:VOC family protein n=1 Tax=Mycolicibacterium neoaurum TaxID=1795 RepID=UPI0026727995|nr:VOC family protein [Mycolicibacterium neoaurum]MDO3402682.1 VOC family protein [Mycolicibacterium neoaurum]
MAAGVAGTPERPLVVQFDHIIIATTDLERSAARLAETTGLIAVAGGIHDGLGTHNVIVPLGRGYLELVAAHDGELAQHNPFGQLVLSALVDTDEAFAGWAVEVDDVALQARALATDEHPGRLTRRGVGIQHLGIPGAIASPGLPFILTRDPGSQNPEAMAVTHRLLPTGVRSLSLAESRFELDTWLATPETSVDPPLPVTCAGAGRGIISVEIASVGGILILTAAAPSKGTRE